MTLLLIILLLGSIVLCLVAMPCDVIAEGRAQLECLGCRKGAFIPDCPVHDERRRNGEVSQTIKEKGSS